ncbi:MAG: ABC transporter permease [Erysipelotrichaceae bacterium]
MKLFRDTGLLFRRKMMETLRNPIYIVMSLLNPVLYLVLFSPLLSKLVNVDTFSSGNIMNIFVPGLLVIVAFLEGLFVGYDMIDEVRSGVIERFRVTPTSRFALLAGNVTRDLANMLVVVCFFTLIAIPFGFKIHPLGYLIFMSILSMIIVTTSAFGNALGLILKDEDKLSPIIQGVNLPVLLLSGMLLPMELAPKWLQFIAHFNPVYYAVEAGRLLTNGVILNIKVGEAFLFLIPLTVITLIWATSAFNKAVS